VRDGQAIGVEIESDGGRERVLGRRVTLAAGAIGSPAILMRSGIGPQAALRDAGIEPLLDLPGVGAGLADHPVTRLLLVPRAGSCDPQTPLAQVVLRYTASGSGEFNDMQQVIFSHVDVAGIGGEQAVAAVGAPWAIGLPVALEHPRGRGRVTVTSPDAHVPPGIELDFASDAEDLRRLVEGVRLAWQIAQQPEIARHVDHVALLTDEAMSEDEALAAYVRATVSTQFHPCGTARMGPPDCSTAVVDQQCRLRGVARLRVVDASVMPTIPRANINLTCMMIAERVSDWMREGT
jgi:choline dehydrogenase